MEEVGYNNCYEERRCENYGSKYEPGMEHLGIRTANRLLRTAFKIRWSIMCVSVT